jgi:hypothetical protein
MGITDLAQTAASDVAVKTGLDYSISEFPLAKSVKLLYTSAPSDVVTDVWRQATARSVLEW